MSMMVRIAVNATLGEVMKAITTRYAGPTDTRGSRIIATEPDGARVS